MNEQKYIARVQWLVITGAALLLLLLAGAWLFEGSRKEWKVYQRRYERVLEELSGDMEQNTTEPPERGIFQVELPQFGRIDRCVSCHVGLENPGMEHAAEPLRRHPGTFLADHPVQDYGCTICHGGQGRALTVNDAHGRRPAAHWPYPLLEKPYIQSSCGKCHLAIFDPALNAMRTVPQERLTETADPLPGTDTAMPGMEVFLEGKFIFSSEGCLGCHKARGVGGILGPDLTEQGEKTRHEYSFQNIKGEQTISNWLVEHFKDPEMVSPGSQMLRIDLNEDDLRSLATFVMGLAKPDIPFSYFTMPALREFKGIRESLGGSTAYAYLCSACHGKEGKGKGYEQYETGIPAIGNADFLRVASGDFIRFTVLKGRSRRQMASWAEEISGITGKEITGLANHLVEQYPAGGRQTSAGKTGNRPEGRRLFERYCLTCHGEDGKGGVAVALNQQGFLERAGNEFILSTLILGRDNTAMPAWGHLPDSDLLSLVEYIRFWGGSPRPAEQTVLPEGDPEEGALRYHYLCSRCHGEFGAGETGPAIINRDFLTVASDRYLYETIAFGRIHTAMFGWSADVYNQEKLDREDIAHVIEYMRVRAALPPEYIRPGSNPGHHEPGAALFAQHCAECHGSEGQGEAGPALNNQEFLSAASNGYILATITVGREKTAMPAWGYGQEGYPVLTGDQRLDLVAYIRTWQRIHISF